MTDGLCVCLLQTSSCFCSYYWKIETVTVKSLCDRKWRETDADVYDLENFLQSLQHYWLLEVSSLAHTAVFRHVIKHVISRILWRCMMMRTDNNVTIILQFFESFCYFHSKTTDSVMNKHGQTAVFSYFIICCVNTVSDVTLDSDSSLFPSSGGSWRPTYLQRFLRSRLSSSQNWSPTKTK